jgi:hypothetical protein
MSLRIHVRALGPCLLAAGAAVASAGAAQYALNVNPAASMITVKITAFGVSDSDSSPVAGTVGAVLTPSPGPFAQIHVTDLDLSLTQSMSFDLTVVVLGGFKAQTQDFKLKMGGDYGAAGPPTSVGAGGAFTQTGNFMQPLGLLHYQGSGILGSGIGTGTLDLATQPAFVFDLSGTALDDGSLVTLTMPLNVQQTGDFQGIAVTLNLTGTLVATAATIADLPGDFDGDGCVSQSDLGTLLANFNCTPAPDACPGDADGDGDTDQSDLGILLAHYGEGCR